MSQRTLRFALLGFALLQLAGCDRRTVEERSTGFKMIALAAREEAIERRKNKEPKKALRAAQRAVKARDGLRALFGELPKDIAPEIRGSVKADLDEAGRAANQAVYFGEIAGEEKQLEDLRGSWSVRAYKIARTVVIPKMLLGMALAAREADKSGLGKLPADLQNLAFDAAELTGLEKADGSPDWLAIADALEVWSGETPLRLHFILAAVHGVLKKDSFAIYELDQIDEANLKDPADRLVYHVIRGGLYTFMGLKHMGRESIEQALAMVGVEDDRDGIPEMQAIMHLAFAIYLGHSEKDWDGAMVHVSLATKAYPNNPATIFLTGERLLANGEIEKASGTLIDLLNSLGPSEHNEWIAATVADRVRQIRDTPGEVEPLKFDAALVFGLAKAFGGHAAARSRLAEKVAAWIESTENFARELEKKLTVSELTKFWGRGIGTDTNGPSPTAAQK